MLGDESLEGREKAQEVKLGKDALAWMLPSRRKMDLLRLCADLRPAPASTGVAVSPHVTPLQKGTIRPTGTALPGAETEATCSQRLSSTLSALRLQGL